MRNLQIAILVRSCLGGCLLVPAIAPALAQSAENQSPEIPQSSAAELSPGVTLEQVIVTARKRVETAQDTPISLTVATGEDLIESSARTFVDLAQQSPALQITNSALSSSSVVLSMRGQVLPDTRLNTDPAIGIYLDGVYVPRAQGTEVSELIDMERVEILAGPQGTLYGKNTTGGAINMYTRTPTQVLEGNVRARYGNNGEWSVGGVFNTPVSDQLAVRLVGSVTRRDGYGTNAFNGRPFGELDAESVRISALWTPTDAVTVTLRGDYAQSKATGPAWKGFNTLLPTSLAITEASVAAGLPRDQAEALLRSYRNDDYDNGSMSVHPTDDFEVWGASVTIDWELGEDLSLKSITAMRGFTRDGSADLDGTPFQILDYPYMHAEDKQFSQELQLLGSALDDRLSWITGAYYSDEEAEEATDQIALGTLSAAAGTLHQRATDIGAKSLGVFAQGTYAFTDRFSATLGARYTEDKRELTASNYNDLQCQSLGVNLVTLPGVDACRRPMSADFNEYSYTASLEFQATDQVLLYAKTNRGYRAGGLQQTGAGTTPAIADALNEPFKPETVTDYELGIKSQWFDNRLLANIAVYHSELEDAIRSVSQPIAGTTAVGTRQQNAASATVDGVELEIRAIPVDWLELGATAAFMDAAFDSYITPVGEDRSNIPMLFAPDLQYGLSATFTPVEQWRTRIDWNWRDEVLSAETAAYVPSYGILNARTTWRFDQAGIELSLYGKNLNDERYYAYPVDISGSLGFIYSSYANAPRTYGIEFVKNF